MQIDEQPKVAPKKRAPHKKKIIESAELTEVSANTDSTLSIATQNEQAVEDPSPEKNQQQFEEAKAELQDPSKALEAYLNDPVVSRNVLSWGEALEKQFGKKWFTTQEVCKNRQIFPSRIEAILQVMILKGQAHRRVYGIAGSEMVKYKITLTLSDKILLLKEEAAELGKRQEAVLKQIQVYEASASVDARGEEK